MTYVIITEPDESKTLWETVRDVIQSASSGDTIVLPENIVLETDNEPILVEDVDDLTIKFNGTRIVNVGTGARPDRLVRFVGCNNLRLHDPYIECNGTGTTGSNTFYGLTIANCNLARVFNPYVNNAPLGNTSYCLFFSGVNTVLMEGGLIKNGGYGCVRFQSCQVVDVLNTDLEYDDDRDMTTDQCRWANWETSTGSLTAKFWRWKGGLWKVKAGMTNTSIFNFNPVNNTGRCEHAELDGVIIDNQDYVVSGNMFSGKSEDVYNVVMRNCWFNVPGNTTAVRHRLLKNGGSLVVENCRFEAGNVEYGTYGGDSISTVSIRNSVFVNAGNNSNGSVFSSSSNVLARTAIEIDKDTRFYNVGSDATAVRFFFNRNSSNPTAFGMANKFDCKIYTGSGTGQIVLFRFPDKLGSHRLGPHFRVFNDAERIVTLGYSHSEASGDGSRLCITGFDGIGRLDHLQELWLDEATGTMGVVSTSSTSGTNHRVVDSIPVAVPARLGDRIINHNPENGFPAEWEYTSTGWRVRNRRFQVL